MTRGKSGNWNYLLIFVFIAFGIYLISSGLFQTCSTYTPTLPPRNPEQIEPLKQYLISNHKTPQEFIIKSFTDYDIIFLGELFCIKQNVNLVKELIPLLHEQGICNLGIAHALYIDQQEIDTLLSAPEYDEQKAREILFRRHILWGYQEYVDLFKAAWELNNSLLPGQKVFRILGINMELHREFIKTEKDGNDPEVIKKVLGNKNPDQFMAEVIEKELLEKNEKALIYCDITNSFIDYIHPQYKEEFEKIGIPYSGSAAYIIHRKAKGRCSSIFFHIPWPLPDQRYFSFPVEGVIDVLMKEIPYKLQHSGFSTGDTPFGELPILNNFVKNKGDQILLKELCSGYIIQGPISSYRAATPIKDFINENNIERAKAEYPGENNESLTSDSLNDYIRQMTENIDTLFTETFR